jgi:glycosyltransferase involved in cell wall biosynthesis
MTRVKVLQAIRQGAIGGGESHVLDLVEHLDKKVYEPIVLAFTEGAMIERLKNMGVHTHVIPTTRPFDFTVWGRVSALLEKEKIELIHIHGTRANTNVVFPGQWNHLPMIYTVHGWSFHDDLPPFQRKLRIWSEAMMTRRMATTITVSEANKRSGEELIRGFRTEVVHYGINLKRFDPARSLANLRAELGIGQDEFLLGYIARITKQKAPLDMLRGFRLALDQLGGAAKLKLLLVGEGEMKAEMLALAKELNLEPQLVIQPFRTDVPEVLAAVDAYCLPSLWEGLPIGLLEAMSMRKPVIASRVDGTANILRDRENGLLIAPQKPQELASAIVALYQDADLRERVARGAHQTILAHYSAERMARQVETVYQNALRAPQKR